MNAASEPGYRVTQLVQRVADLETLVARMANSAGVTVERAKVTTTGAAMCVVTYTSGTTRTLPFLTSYAPAVNDQVLIINSPAWSGVIGKVSA